MNANGDIPLCLFILSALTTGLTFNAANPTDGTVASFNMRTVRAALTTPYVGHTSSVNWLFDADVSESDLAVPLPPTIAGPVYKPAAALIVLRTAAPLPTAPPDYPDVSTDSAASTCDNVPCIIQGHRLRSAIYYNVSCPIVAYPALCGAVKSTYDISPIRAGLTYLPSNLSAPANTLEAFSLGSSKETAPGLYGPITVTNRIDVYGVPMGEGLASLTQSVRVLCSVAAGTCASPPNAATIYRCAPTPAPLLGEGAEVAGADRIPMLDARKNPTRRYATSGDNLALVEPDPDGSCVTAPPVVRVRSDPQAFVDQATPRAARQATKRKAEAASPSP